VGFGTDELPAFWSRSSGLALRHRVDTFEQLAAAHLAHRRLGLAGGLLVANPVPEGAEIPAAEIEGAIEEAVAAATVAGVGGHRLTPYLLDRIATTTGGRGVTTNLALAESNAAVAGGFAAAIARSRGRPSSV
jgi:pseudouridine-5'-phosphate glycosidase